MLKENLLLGQYYLTESLLHRLDARSKILITLVYMVALFMSRSLLEYLILCLILIVSVMLSNIPIKTIWKGMRIILVFVVLTAVFNIFLTRGDEIWHLGVIKITREGLHKGLIMGSRLLLLVAFTSLLTLVTRPLDLTDGMERLLSPLSYLGIPTYELALIMSIALRFIPTILEELERIIMVQKARGADFHSRNLKKRVKQLMPLLVPLFVSAFRRADELALAMEAKGYSGGKNRSRWKVTRWRICDTISLLLFIFLWLVIIGLNSFVM